MGFQQDELVGKQVVFRGVRRDFVVQSGGIRSARGHNHSRHTTDTICEFAWRVNVWDGTHRRPCSSYRTTVGTLLLNAHCLSSGLDPGTVGSAVPNKPDSMPSLRLESETCVEAAMLGRVWMMGVMMRWGGDGEDGGDECWNVR